MVEYWSSEILSNWFAGAFEPWRAIALSSHHCITPSLHHSILFAADIEHLNVMIAASTLVGAGVFMLTWWFLRALASEDIEQGDQWRYDVNRMNELRRLDTLYRLAQPLILALARLNRATFTDSLPKIQREIGAAGLPRFWLPEEYLARCQVIAALLCPFYLWMFMKTFGVAGILISLGAVVLTAWYLRIRLGMQARYRVVLIKRRMPFLLDLLTLLMEAGTTFLNALDQAVKEFEGHPTAVEFGRVLSDMQLGKTRNEAFQSMQRRLADDEITGILGAIIQGEELGSPLAQVFRTQSDVLRIKRTQRAEKMAGEAGVNMLLPGMLVMAATVLIILGPFIIKFMFSGLIL